MKTELDNILALIMRRGYFGYELKTDSHAVWIVDSYGRPCSLRCNSVLEAWKSFLEIELSTPEEARLRHNIERANAKRLAEMYGAKSKP